MGLSGLGYPLTPGEVNAKLTSNAGLTDNGYVIWSKVATLTNTAVAVVPVDNSYARIDRELAANRPVIVKVLLGVSFNIGVLVVGKEGQEYIALDSLNKPKNPCYCPVCPAKFMQYGCLIDESERSNVDHSPTFSERPLQRRTLPRLTEHQRFARRGKLPTVCLRIVTAFWLSNQTCVPANCGKTPLILAMSRNWCGVICCCGTKLPDAYGAHVGVYIGPPPQLLKTTAIR